MLARKFRQKRKDLQNYAVLEVSSPSEFFDVSITLVNFWSRQAQKHSLHTQALRGRFHNARQPRGEAFSISRFIRVESRVFLFHIVQGTFFPRELSPCTNGGIPHRRSSHEARPFSIHTLYHDAGKTARKRCMDSIARHSDLPSGACIPRQQGMPSFTHDPKQKQRRMEGL